MDFENYFNLAKTKNKIVSNNKFGKVLGITGTSISQFINGKTIPSDDTMLKIADLAGVDKKNALIDLNIWRNENNPAVKSVWESFKNLTTE